MVEKSILTTHGQLCIFTRVNHLTANPGKTMRLLTVLEVAKMCGVAAPSIMRWVKVGHFPAPIKLGNPNKRGPVRWRSNDLDEWLASHDTTKQFCLREAIDEPKLGPETD